MLWVVLGVLAIGVICFLLLGNTTLWGKRGSDPELELRTAVELHKVRRQLDAALLRTEIESEADQVRRGIADELRDSR